MTTSNAKPAPNWAIVHYWKLQFAKVVFSFAILGSLIAFGHGELTFIAFGTALILHVASRFVATAYRLSGLLFIFSLVALVLVIMLVLLGDFALLVGGLYIILATGWALAFTLEYEPHYRFATDQYFSKHGWIWLCCATWSLVWLGISTILIIDGRQASLELNDFQRGYTAWLNYCGLLLSSLILFWLFRRPFVEFVSERIVSWWYSVRAEGAGLNDFPMSGPCLVIANHGCWFDPLFIAKVLHRPVTPIMTQHFYDKWYLKPLLKYIFRVIVVPEKSVRHEAPELEQAVAALDRGECVMIFPEGYLQRKAEQPLRRFGQGIWHILAARPDTPVVACWVENGWGSYVSYFNGPPTKNKPFDWFREITVGIRKPIVLPAVLLKDGLATRFELMGHVALARQELNLPAPEFTPPTASVVLPVEPPKTDEPS